MFISSVLRIVSGEHSSAVARSQGGKFKPATGAFDAQNPTAKPDASPSQASVSGLVATRRFGYLQDGSFTPITMTPQLTLSMSLASKRRFDSSVSDGGDVEPQPSPEKKSKRATQPVFVHGSSMGTRGGMTVVKAKARTFAIMTEDGVIDIPSDSDDE